MVVAEPLEASLVGAVVAPSCVETVVSVGALLSAGARVVLEDSSLVAPPPLEVVVVFTGFWVVVPLLGCGSSLTSWDASSTFQITISST